MMALAILEWASLRLEWLPSGDKMDTVPVLAPAMVAKEYPSQRVQLLAP